jgi:hypothetical protein
VRSTKAEDLKKRAEELLHTLGQSDMYANHAGGVVGYLIRQDNTSWTPAQIETAMRELGIPSDYVPTTAILRDAMPHMIHLRRLLLPITSGCIHQREELLVRLGRLVREFESPDMPLVLELGQLREMGKEWTADLPK